MSDILVSDLIQALWVDAGNETDEAKRRLLENDARMFQEIWERSKYALAPSRNQMQYAVMATGLNISDRLDAVLDISKDTHLKMQELYEQIPTLGEGVREALDAVKKLSTQVNTLGTVLGNVVSRVDTIEEKVSDIALTGVNERARLDQRLQSILIEYGRLTQQVTDLQNTLVGKKQFQFAIDDLYARLAAPSDREQLIDYARWIGTIQDELNDLLDYYRKQKQRGKIENK